jgi:hypothetical protein
MSVVVAHGAAVEAQSHLLQINMYHIDLLVYIYVYIKPIVFTLTKQNGLWLLLTLLYTRTIKAQ